jgi:hypothetical protein
MRSLRRLVVNALVPLWVVSAAAAARAQEAAPAPGIFEDIDDPKLARRLGTRVEISPSPPLAPGAVVAPSGAPAPIEAEARPSEPVPPASAESSEARTPRLKLGYRRFTFAQLAPTMKAGTAGDEPFDVLSVDFYLASSTWRVGLTTQYGWEEGTFRQGGDAFIAQSASLGWQIPGPVLTPFFEGYAGGGLMQRTHPGLGLNTIATAYGQLGLDVGTELFLARYFCLSFAFGYIHASDWFVKDKAFASIAVDTWSFKLGVGL